MVPGEVSFRQQVTQSIAGASKNNHEWELHYNFSALGGHTKHLAIIPKHNQDVQLTRSDDQNRESGVPFSGINITDFEII